jgi:Transcriptional regulators
MLKKEQYYLFYSIIAWGDSMKYLFYRLIIFLDTANESDTNYNIAWYMANNFSKVSKMGISELAKECYVSPATISRFCRTLGYENFAHLKQECSTFTLAHSKWDNLAKIPQNLITESPIEATKYYLNKIKISMDDLIETLDWKVIDQALKVIYQSEDIVFFGSQFSHSAALHLQTDLMMVNKFSVAYMDTERQLESAKKLDKDSVAIIISVNGNYQNTGSKALKYIERSKAKTIVITQNSNMPFANNADYLILLGDENYMKMGKHNLLTVVELLSCRYFSLFR